MNTNRQIFLNHCPTAGASLGCVARINQHTLSTSILSFVLSVLCKLIPGCIRDAFREAVVLKHSLSIQLFQCDDPVLINQLTGEFVSKVFAAVGDALVNMTNCKSAFPPFGRTLLRLREFPLGLRKFVFVPAKEAGIVNLLASREGSETCQTNIYPNRLLAFWKWLDRKSVV